MKFLAMIAIAAFLIIPAHLFAQDDSSIMDGKMIAKNTASGSKKGSREKHITREAQTKKGGDQTKIDFGETAIEGERRVPLGTLINQNEADKNYDFVKIRQRWHDEMVQSAGSLDTGSRN